MMLKAVLFLTLVLSLVFSPTVLSAAEWYVDASVAQSGDGKTWGGAFKTIQQGINAAANGDSVTVAEGVYVENINFKGKNIVLQGTDPQDLTTVANTVIDGNQADSVVSFYGTEDDGCVLTGFTIQNGAAERGGGIRGMRWSDHTRATIQYNAIVNNSADYGGGLYACDGLILNNMIFSNTANRLGGGASHCHGTLQENSIAGNTCASDGGALAYCGEEIIDNRIISNTAESDGGGLHQCNGHIRGNKIKGNSAWVGGGVYWCDGLIEGNTIEDNSASSNGGGLYNCDGIVRNNTIIGNSADSAAGIGTCNGTVENNTIAENSAEWRGGGVAYCDGTVRNNTIVGNLTTGASGTGAGVYGCEGSIRSNLIASNTSSSWGGGLAWCSGDIQNCTIFNNSTVRYGGGLTDCSASIQNCIVWGNSAPTDAQLHNSSVPSYSCIQGWGGGGSGNISTDPLFVDRNGFDNILETYEDNDLRLGAGSGCIDKGQNAPWMAGSLDLDGNNRIFVGASWPTVDMGAYEYGSFRFTVTQVELTTTPFPGGLRLTWTSRPGDTYEIRWRGNADTGPWVVEVAVPSQGTSTTWTDPNTSPSRKFYKIQLY